eukprot:CAMPEP_0172151956 /NCGR_PEP_ID=MMETSP1050-20130122/547_1 /TAXON_ID=233186 /ORGANISM="Cryptomonas curvata, Strain CCAP979/52" /LENGTH=40 /DNA_ID= /DNA_START= /DNA_END= /DNA_ORIENTATION=
MADDEVVDGDDPEEVEDGHGALGAEEHEVQGRRTVPRHAP